MSGYDEWKQEAPEDHDHRMHVHDRGPAPESYGGVCACGTETTRAVSTRDGHRWECARCSEVALRSIYDRASRKVG